jgi:ATP-binding cassette subfamily B (MDR/TAP) protein 1
MSAPSGQHSGNPDPIADTAQPTHSSAGNVIRDEINEEGATVNSGLPFPSAVGNVNVIPNINTASARTMNEKDGQQTRVPSHTSDEHEKPAAPPSSTSSHEKVISNKPATTLDSQPKAKKGFFARKSKQEQEDKKAKQKEEEANAVPPVSFLGLFRYATWYEKMFNLIGIIFACAAGAAQPLMTLIFGRLTASFTQFSVTANRIALGELPITALDEARVTLKTDSGHNALYLMAIGIGMFLTTWLYMYIWSVTGELNAKRIRERYLASVLRQEVGLCIFTLRF